MTENQKKKKNELKYELKRCLLLADKEKEYWLDRIDTLPEHTIDNTLFLVKKKNDVMDKFIDIVLASDNGKAILELLRNMVKGIKFKAFKMDENQLQEKDMEKLEKIIEILNNE